MPAQSCATVMKKPTPAAAARAIDAQTLALMEEFFQHARKFQATHPGDHDPRKIFEAWSIQKIAALQFTVLQLGDAINELASLMRRK